MCHYGNIFAIIMLFEKFKEVRNSCFHIFVAFSIGEFFGDIFFLQRFDDTGGLGIIPTVITLAQSLICYD